MLNKKPRVRRYEKSFSSETRELFSNNYECWVCGKNTMDAGHHILGGEFEEADSPLNFAPVCNFTCHLGKSFPDEEKSKMLCKTREYLRLIGYRLTDKDKEFIKLNKKFYGK